MRNLHVLISFLMGACLGEAGVQGAIHHFEAAIILLAVAIFLLQMWIIAILERTRA